MSFLVCGECEQCENGIDGLNLGEPISVGLGGQVSRLTNMLAYNKWPTDHLRYEVGGEGQVTSVPG
jgi:hypothetical protein